MRATSEGIDPRRMPVSKLENQDDMQISTLKRIVEALGGEVHVLARFPRGTVRVRQFDQSDGRKPSEGFRELVLF